MPLYSYVYITFTASYSKTVRVEVQDSADRPPIKSSAVRKLCLNYVSVYPVVIAASCKELAIALLEMLEKEYPNREILVDVKYYGGDGYIAEKRCNEWTK